MRRVSAAWAAAAIVALGIVVATAGPASAQTSCQGTQTASAATVTPASLLPGETLSLSGGGFAANQVLGIGLFRPAVVLASVASDANGNYTATIQLPLGTPPGQNEITVFGVGPDSTCHQSLALFTVKELPAPPVTVIIVTPTVIPPVTSAPVPIVVQQPLARTGSPSPALAAAGLVVMLLGFHAVRVAGRRPITG
jgi:hypothetical protein